MQLLRRIRSAKTDEMYKLFVFFLLFELAIGSSTSAGYSMQQNSYEKERSSYGSNNDGRAVSYYYHLPALIASSTPTPGPSSINPRRNSYLADTCGGTVNIPLFFNQLLPYKSTHFPLRRDFPIICNWNFTVKHGNCGRARLTMRLDGRSRLPNTDGCSKGYYTVSPNMKGARICGRLANVPAYIWYVDRQLGISDVTFVTMKNLGINDGYFEGLSFTLQGECVENELFDPTRTNVGKENAKLNRRWMNRVFEDFQVGEGARIAIKPRPKRPPTTASINNNPATTAVISNFQNNTGHWHSNQEINPPRLEYTVATTVSSTTEPINQPNNTNLFYQTSLVMATTSNVDVLSTASSTVGPLTIPSSASVVRTTLTQSTLLFDIATTTSTTKKSPDDVQNDVGVPHINGHKFVFSLLQETLQRTFLKFLKLFS